MNRIRPLFLVCLFLFQGLFASNSYANGLPDWDLLAFPEDGCFDVKEDGQCTWFPLDGTKYVGELKEGKRWKGIEFGKDGNVTATYSEGASTLTALTAEQEIKELIALRRQIDVKLVALRRQIDVKLEELLHQKMEGKEAEEENLFEIFTTLFELIELESAIDMRIEERQQG